MFEVSECYSRGRGVRDSSQMPKITLFLLEFKEALKGGNAEVIYNKALELLNDADLYEATVSLCKTFGRGGDGKVCEPPKDRNEDADAMNHVAEGFRYDMRDAVERVLGMEDDDCEGVRCWEKVLVALHNFF